MCVSLCVLCLSVLACELCRITLTNVSHLVLVAEQQVDLVDRQTEFLKRPTASAPLPAADLIAALIASTREARLLLLFVVCCCRCRCCVLLFVVVVVVVVVGCCLLLMLLF